MPNIIFHQRVFVSSIVVKCLHNYKQQETNIEAYNTALFSQMIWPLVL